jgi:hypothetical protein
LEEVQGGNKIRGDAEAGQDYREETIQSGWSNEKGRQNNERSGGEHSEIFAKGALSKT